MYRLIKIFGKRQNAPEPLRIPLKKAASVTRGTPVRFEEGALRPFSREANFLPTHMTLADSEGKEVLCYAVTPDMVFEISVAEPPHTMKVGNEYLLSHDGKAVSATLADGSLRGATLMNKTGAKQAGDTILVAFR